MAMPIVAMIVLLGVMFLGGGFGIMATSSAGFDEQEFDRLANAGNLCLENDAILRPEFDFSDSDAGQNESVHESSDGSTEDVRAEDSALMPNELSTDHAA